MSYLYQHSGKNISLAAGSCLTAPIICGSTCVQSAQILGTKVSVGSLNASYDLYNNGTSYLNGAVTIDDSLTITGTRILKTGGYNKPGLQMTGTGNYCWTDLNIFLKNTTAANSAIFSDYEPHAEWGLFHDNTADAFYITAGSSTNNVGNFTIKNCAGTERTTYIKHKFVQGDGLAEIGGRLSVSPDHSSSYNGIAIGCNYTNTGNWHSQLDVYGAGHSVLRINHGCGTDGANNSRNNCIYAHCGNPFVICSSGNIRIKPGTGTTISCGMFCACKICGTTCVYSNCVYTNRLQVDCCAGINCICSSTGMARSFPTWSIVGTRCLPPVTASANLPVGWYTIFVNTGSRAGGRFVLRDTTGSRHQYVVFYASHSYGQGNNINVLHYSRYSGQPIQCIRIKDFSTYDGAALQVYVCDASNTLVAYEAGDNIQANGWYTLNSWCCDACVPYSSSCFNACWPAGCYCDGNSVDLVSIQDGGQMLTGKLIAPVICGCTCVQTSKVCVASCVYTYCLHASCNICGKEICSGSWFRNATSGGGLYNSVTGLHWYSSAANNMILYSGQCNNVGIIGQACGANRGCINWNCHNQIHIYDGGGNVRFLVNSTSDIRLCNTVCQYGNFVSTGRGIFCSVDESLNFKGARGKFTNEYMHLYRKVGIGHPSGWGCGEGNTPDYGLSTYGKACIGYGITAADNNIIVNGGVETTGSHGLTSGTYGAKFYSDNCSMWNIKAGGSSNSIGLKFRDSGGTIDGYVYADNGHIGFLDMEAQWAYGHSTDTCHWWNINNSTRMKLDTDTLHICGAGTCARLVMYSCGMINGYFYANCNRDVGILDGDGNWAIRHRRDTGTYWSINNTDEMCLTTTCLCHSGVICAASCMRTPSFCGTDCVRTPVVCATSVLRSGDWVCGNRVCGGTFYGNGSGLTNVPAGNPDHYCAENDRIRIGRCNMTNISTTQNYSLGSCIMTCVESSTSRNNITIGHDIANYTSAAANGLCYNTFIGAMIARKGCCNLVNNVVIGYQAGYNMGHASSNAAGQNVVVGSYAGSNYSSTFTGCENTFLGTQSGYRISTGCKNTGVGNNAGRCVTTGSCNVFLGFCSGCGHTTGTGYTYVGSRCGSCVILCGNTSVCGSISKSSGCFKIAHPNPAKRDSYDLVHSFVESPTEGDNIYRYTTETTSCRSVIELPDYYSYLNKNDQVWVSANKHFGVGYGEVTEDQKCLVVCSCCDGIYNVLLIGTRKDNDAVRNWNGPEIKLKHPDRDIVDR